MPQDGEGFSSLLIGLPAGDQGLMTFNSLSGPGARELSSAAPVEAPLLEQLRVGTSQAAVSAMRFSCQPLPSLVLKPCLRLMVVGRKVSDPQPHL